MTLKLIITVLLIAVPMCAQAQSPSAPKVNKGDAQKVVTIISGDMLAVHTMGRFGGIASPVRLAGVSQPLVTTETH